MDTTPEEKWANFAPKIKERIAVKAEELEELRLEAIKYLYSIEVQIEKRATFMSEGSDYLLTETGLVIQLTKFEKKPPESADDWRMFTRIIKGLKYVNAESFPYSFMPRANIEKATDLYSRMLAVAETVLK